MTSSVTAYIALGANMGDAVSAVQRALHALDSLPRTRLVAQSSLYSTAPVDASGPDFVNAVAAVSTQLPPPDLLQALQRLEQAAGRQRPYRNAPRTLDLDVLLYGDVLCQCPTLTLPHPRMYQRAFVLVPLAEIAPHLVTPQQLHAVAGQQIVRMAM